jgi:group I intron endonuclease
MEETYEDMLDIRECAWIRYCKSDQEQFGYNLQTGGHFNKRLSDETKRKMSEARSGKNHWLFGKHHSEEHKQKLSKLLKGRPNPQISKALKGRKLSEEACKKMSEGWKRRSQNKLRV